VNKNKGDNILFKVIHLFGRSSEHNLLIFQSCQKSSINVKSNGDLSLFFWDVMQYVFVVTEVAGQPIGPILKAS
jgi:hypothetical protein